MGTLPFKTDDAGDLMYEKVQIGSFELRRLINILDGVDAKQM